MSKISSSKRRTVAQVHPQQAVRTRLKIRGLLDQDKGGRIMNRLTAAVVAPILGLTVAIAMAAHSSSSTAAPLPDPAVDIPLAKAAGVQMAVLAGGCFWGVEGVFEHVKGVTRVVSGYSGGTADTVRYRQVSSGRTGHAEAVRISYDPARISYGQLLKVFFPSRMTRPN
jgi:peptide-methionine (S)-S-oxide reductase